MLRGTFFGGEGKKIVHKNKNGSKNVRKENSKAGKLMREKK